MVVRHRGRGRIAKAIRGGKPLERDSTIPSDFVDLLGKGRGRRSLFIVPRLVTSLSMKLPGGLETCDGCADMGAGTPCGRTRWGHRWRSLGGTKHAWCATWARGRHVGAPAGATGGVLWGAPNVRRVCRNGGGGAMWTRPMGPWVERPGEHETCEGCAEIGAGTPCGRARWGHGWSALGGRDV